MTRKQIEAILKGCEGGGAFYVSPGLSDMRALCDLALAGLDAEAKIAEAYRRGASDMRERAAAWGCNKSAAAIRSLPIEGEG